MQKLSPQAESLIRAGRPGLRPSQADRERVLGELRQRLGDAAVLGATGSAGIPYAGVTSRLWLRLVVASGVGVGVIAGIHSLATRPDPKPQQPALVLPLNAPPQTPSLPPLAAASSAPAELVPEPASADSPPAVPARAQSRLAEEVAILSRATSALRGGRAIEALATLEEHQRKFPGGVLAQERRSARAQALCSLGRMAEANAELNRLSKSSPQSPSTLRAKQYCEQRSRQR